VEDYKIHKKKNEILFESMGLLIQLTSKSSARFWQGKQMNL